jgi:hypothetical protein
MRLFLLSFILLTASVFAQNSKTYQIDFKDPKSVVNALFYSAQTRDFEVLQCLCDPFGENEGDTRSLCSISSLMAQISEFGGNAATQHAVNQFVQMYQQGRISGQITFEEVDGNKFANVPFYHNHLGGPSGSNESMKLINRYGNWYFYSF